MTFLGDDRGQATFLTIIFLAALVGAIALVLHLGSWFREQRGTLTPTYAAAFPAAKTSTYDGM